ncbi:hypothetical protein FGIG_11975 [Fasciola gigantica]|uniref:Uncharacterized protein n=1 Tax=Fasciola gigantica TaxID=46835 RepID=A0A504YDQ1_FASGI|nr:hypothetical protein FGIG_11975 [Fasciola gigantica]
MKTVAGIVSDVRYWLVIPSGFFFGILFGLYLGHYYQGSIPILHINDEYVRLREVNSTTLKDVVVIDDISNTTRHLRLACMIMTMPANRVKARAVQNTWAPRCDAYYFLSSVVDAELHSIGKSFCDYCCY